MLKLSPAPLALTLATGSALAQSNTPTLLERENPNITPDHIAHIYYNLVTNEKIATSLSNNFRPAIDDQSYEVWITENDQPCTVFGSTVSNSTTLDYYCEFCSAFYPIGNTLLDWGDIPPDTIIDCVEITWISKVMDTDSDADQIGDGVLGFGTEWSFFDSDNGFNSCTRQPLVSFRLINLPGSLNLNYARYTATVDLGAGFDSPLSFEFGDSDGDPQDAATHNPFVFSLDANNDGYPDGDIDRDGYADISYAVRYYQPGSTDFDNADGDNDESTGVDGDPNQRASNAVALSAPNGTTIEIDNGDGTFSYEIDTSTVHGANAYGAEDVWEEYDVYGFFDSAYWMGGFSCYDDPIRGPNAFGQIKISMYGPNPVPFCQADLTGDGILDIFDVFAYLDLYNAGNLAADCTGDGILDIFDVFAFLDVFNAGCP